MGSVRNLESDLVQTGVVMPFALPSRLMRGPHLPSDLLTWIAHFTISFTRAVMSPRRVLRRPCRCKRRIPTLVDCSVECANDPVGRRTIVSALSLTLHRSDWNRLAFSDRLADRAQYLLAEGNRPGCCTMSMRSDRDRKICVHLLKNVMPW